MTLEASHSVTTGLLTTEDVANLYRVDVSTVRRWARSGDLPSVRTPGGGRIRFDVAEIIAKLGESRRADVEAAARLRA